MRPDEIRAHGKKKRWGREYVEYWAAHPFDEALLALGLAVPSAPPHHLRTRGAHGNCDEPWNLIALCPENHRKIHQSEALFLEEFPYLGARLKRAAQQIWEWERTKT